MTASKLLLFPAVFLPSLLLLLLCAGCASVKGYLSAIPAWSCALQLPGAIAGPCLGGADGSSP